MNDASRPIQEVPRFVRPWWDKRPDIAVYVQGLFGTMSVIAMAAECARRFGPGEAPSKSGIARFMTHLRGGEFRGQTRKHRRPVRGRPERGANGLTWTED